MLPQDIHDTDDEDFLPIFYQTPLDHIKAAIEKHNLKAEKILSIVPNHSFI